MRPPKNNGPTASEIAAKQIRIGKLQLLVAICSSTLSFLALIAAIVTIYLTYLSMVTKFSDLTRGVENVKREVLADRLVILGPKDGDNVAFTEVVRGRTPFQADLNHYIVVTTPQGSDRVQDSPVTIAGGTFSGTARFGEAGAGLGETYVVRVLLTSFYQQPGPLIMPPDAVFSSSVSVRRK